MSKEDQKYMLRMWLDLRSEARTLAKGAERGGLQARREAGENWSEWSADWSVAIQARANLLKFSQQAKRCLARLRQPGLRFVDTSKHLRDL